MTLPSVIIVVPIIICAIAWLIARQNPLKNILFLAIILLLTTLFWKITGILYAAVFLLIGLIITLILMQLSPHQVTPPRLGKRLLTPTNIILIAISIVTIILTLIIVKLVNTQFVPDRILQDYNEQNTSVIWIFLILLTLFSLQFYLLTKNRGK